MTNEQLQVGDEVYLKTGTVAMTVNEIKADGTVEVIYQRGSTTKREVLKPEVLRKKLPQQAVQFSRATFKKGF